MKFEHQILWNVHKDYRRWSLSLEVNSNNVNNQCRLMKHKIEHIIFFHFLVKPESLKNEMGSPVGESNNFKIYHDNLHFDEMNNENRSFVSP